MVDINQEVNAEFHRKVGELVCLLAVKANHVRVGKADSILGDDILTLRVTAIKGNFVYHVEELLTRSLVESIRDTRVVADALLIKLDKQRLGAK